MEGDLMAYAREAVRTNLHNRVEELISGRLDENANNKTNDDIIEVDQKPYSKDVSDMYKNINEDLMIIVDKFLDIYLTGQNNEENLNEVEESNEEDREV